MPRPKELENPKVLNVRLEVVFHDILAQLVEHPGLVRSIQKQGTLIRRNLKEGDIREVSDLEVPDVVKHHLGDIREVCQGDVIAFLILSAGQSAGLVSKDGLLKSNTQPAPGPQDPMRES